VRKRIVVVLVVLVLAGLIVAERHAIVGAALRGGLALATGYDVRIEDQRLGYSHAALGGVEFRQHGREVFSARRIDVWYSLRDLLPGSTRRFGLVGIAIDHPSLTITRYSDGSYDLPFPKTRASLPALAPAPNPVPVRFFVRVVDANGSLHSEDATNARAAPLGLRNIEVNGTVDSAGRTRYAVTGAFVERTVEPFEIRGSVNVPDGYAMHRMIAPVFPMQSLANFLIASKDVRVLAGTARNFEARAFAIGRKSDGTFDYHVSLGFDVSGGSLALVGLVRPVENISGRLGLFDETLFIQGLRASLAGIPMRAEGAIYNFSRPQIRIGVSGAGDMAALRTAFRFSRSQPLSGPLKIGVLVAGSLDDPTVDAHASSPLVHYRGMPFRDLAAGIQYYHTILALSPLRLHYGAIDTLGLGTLEIGDHIHERMFLRFDAPADGLPYVGAILGSQPLLGDAAVDGSDLLLHVAGSLTAAGDVKRAAALFDFDPNGDANVAPFWMGARGGELAGGLRMDRPAGTSALWLFGEHLAMGTVESEGLPGVALPQVPAMSGHVDRIGMVIGGSTSSLAIAGSIAASRTSIANLPFSSLGARFDGTLRGAAISDIRATGPWGRFAGAGLLSNDAVLARGRFDGTLGALRPALAGVTASGAVNGEVAVGVERQGVVVQANGLRMDGASVDGIPIAAAEGTLVIGDGGVRVYSAHVRAAGGDMIAAGRYPGAVAFVADNIDAGALGAMHVPVDSGRLAAAGELSGGSPLPSFTGNVSIANGRARGYAIDGSAAVSLRGESIDFEHAVAGVGGVYGFASGSIGALLSGAPAYDLHADVPAADIVTAMRALGESNYMTEGTVNADLSIRGAGDRPEVSGTVGVPAGSVNGLDFLDGHARIVASTKGVSAEDGSVLVHSTRASFGAAASSAAESFSLSAPSANLSDFNDFFDTGDTLAGTGKIAFAIDAEGSRVGTTGDIAVRALRVRSLPIGDTFGAWSSNRNVLSGNVAIGGAEGLLRAHGSIALALGPTWQSTVKNSRYDLAANVQGLDLGLWVAAAGFPQVPITGRAFGSASMIGRYPALRLQGTASLRNGTIGRFPINSFDMSFGSSGRRFVIRQASVTGPGITATASGSAGLRKTDPIDLRVDAATNELPELISQLTNAHVPITGSFSASVHMGGVLASPVFDAAFSGTNVDAGGVPIATIFGAVRLQGSKLELHDSGATFAHGSATLAGVLPLRLKPLGLPKNTPVNFTLDAKDVDAAAFDALFGHDTHLGGLLAANVALSGTVENPRMAGRITIEKGSYASALDLTPISGASGTLTFGGSTIEVERFHANAGAGTVGFSGRIDLAGSSGPSIDGTLLARGAQFNSPALGSATIDSNLSLKRSAGDALLSGTATITNATIPFAAFLGSNGNGSGGPAWPLAFDLKLVAGSNVRVRGNGYGAGLDISGTGSATLGGTLASPTLDGQFNSTGGSLTYFDRAFRVQSGRVTFAPSDGILPTLQATGTTTVVNPDPDAARNPYGSATITIDVNGPVGNLNVRFASDPPGYSREQIIAMLAPLGGFVSGIQFSNPYAVQIPGGAAPVVNNAPVPGGVFIQQNGTLTISQEAFSILNAQFGQALLSPVENVLGEVLGESDVNLTLGYFGNIGISVRRVLGKTVSAVYSSTFGLPNRQSFGIRVAPDAQDAASLSFFYETGTQRLFETPGSVFGPVLFGQPLEGQSGFSFDFRHFFK
jgi:hypothetical protein